MRASIKDLTQLEGKVFVKVIAGVDHSFGRAYIQLESGMKGVKALWRVVDRQDFIWEDVWLEECPLKTAFQTCLKICHNQEISMEGLGEESGIWILEEIVDRETEGVDRETSEHKSNRREWQGNMELWS